MSRALLSGARRRNAKGEIRLLCTSALAWVFFLLAVPSHAEGPVARHSIDRQEITRLTKMHPGALSHLELGETLAMQGKTEEALAHFEEGAKNAPESSLIARRECQALTILRRRPEAIKACLQAIRGESSAMDLRAMVAAVLSGSDPPTTNELAQAMRFARRARDSMPGEPWGYAAECDVAERIGNAQMLETCLGNLQRVAPGHYETLRAAEAAAPHGLTWGVWAGWLAIFVLAFGTLAHALWRALRSSTWRRRSAPGHVALSAALAVAVGLGSSGVAHADSSAQEPPANAHKGMLSDWPVDDNDPEGSVPTDQKKNRNPLQFGYWLMDLAYKAAEATKKGNHEAATKYYKAMVKAVPDRSVSFTRLCESYEAAGDWKNAVETCSTALTRPGVTANDFQHYFTLALAKKGSLTGQEVEVLGTVVQHVRDDATVRDLADDLDCQLAVRVEDVGLLQKCSDALAARAPNDPRTLSFQWALAVKRGNMTQAKTLLERARSTDMKPEGIAQMERGMASFEATRRRKLYAWTLGALAIVVGLGAGLVFATRRRSMARATT
jgi:tetratricopeptide (TPR) repeat protein